MAVSDTPSSNSVQKGKTGVLLVNLGSPEAPNYLAVRRYLAEFLSDRRVIQFNPIVWQPILQLIILTFRPLRTAANYRKIWMQAPSVSPLVYYTQRQASSLQTAFDENEVLIDWAMRYGRPSIQEKLHGLLDQGCDRILISPLYPQYSDTTTTSVIDKVELDLKKLAHRPQVRYLPPYFKNDAYIQALKISIEKRVAEMSPKPDHVLLSFHGIPTNYVEKGDPYTSHCEETFRRLVETLNLPGTEIKLTYQSRFGPTEWLQPYTDQTLEELGKSGAKSVLLVTPGFAADCIETLEELDIAGRELFLQAGGEHYDRVPCLNDSVEGINMLKLLIEADLTQWANEA